MGIDEDVGHDGDDHKDVDDDEDGDEEEDEDVGDLNISFGDDYKDVDVSVDDDENGDDNLDEGGCNHQWGLSCCLCPGHGDGGTSVQVLIMIMMTHFWHF